MARTAASKVTDEETVWIALQSFCVKDPAGGIVPLTATEGSRHRGGKNTLPSLRPEWFASSDADDLEVLKAKEAAGIL